MAKSSGRSRTPCCETGRSPAIGSHPRLQQRLVDRWAAHGLHVGHPGAYHSLGHADKNKIVGGIQIAPGSPVPENHGNYVAGARPPEFILGPRRAKAYTWIWKPEAGVARVKQKVMTKQECDFTIAHLDELWGLIQALKVLHGLEFPEVLERCRELLSRLADDSKPFEFLEVHRFLDWAEAIIKPSLQELPEYQHALRNFLAACRVTGPIA